MKHLSWASPIFALMSLAAAASAADSPASPSKAAQSPAADCKTLAVGARKECEAVAAQMVQPSSGTDSNRAVPQHSSPIMVTAKEKAAAAARDKGEDPRKAVEKVEAKEKEPVL